MNTKAALNKKALQHESADYLSMIRERDALNAKIEKIASARVEAIQTVKMVVSKYSLTADELFGDSKPAKNVSTPVEKVTRAKKAASKAAKPVAKKAAKEVTKAAAKKTTAKTAKVAVAKAATPKVTPVLPKVASPAPAAKKVVVKTGAAKAAGSVTDANPLPFTISKK